MAEVPTLTIAGLSEAEKCAVVIADNRLPERAVWDFELLQEHFKKLIEIDFEVELTGFSTGEVDLLMDGKAAPASVDPADDLSGLALDGPAVCAQVTSGRWARTVSYVAMRSTVSPMRFCSSARWRR